LCGGEFSFQLKEVLSSLTKAKIVNVQSGTHGGYSASVRPGLTAWDVAKVAEPILNSLSEPLIMTAIRLTLKKMKISEVIDNA